MLIDVNLKVKMAKNAKKYHENVFRNILNPLIRFIILELQNRIAKSSYAKWRHTPFYRNSFFELLTQIRKTFK